MKNLLLILSIVLLVLLSSCEPPGPEVYSFDFEDSSLGLLESDPVEWGVIELADGNIVAVPTGGATSDLYFNRNIGGDFIHSVEFNVQVADRGVPNIGFTNENEMINLLFSDNKAFLHGAGSPDNYSDGTEIDLQINLDTWYKLDVEVSSGNIFSVYLDNVEIISHTFQTSGNFSEIIYWGHPDPTIYLDNIEITVE